MGTSEAVTQGAGAPEPETDGSPVVAPREHRGIGIRIFSSASDAPRARRPTDVVLLIGAVLTVLVLSIPAPGPTALDTAITNLVKELPGLFGWFWELAWNLLIVWAVVLMIMALAGHRRKRLFLDELFAAGLTLGLALLVGRLSGTDWSDSLGSMVASKGPPVYLAVRLAMATAVIVVASPHMTHALRFVGRGVIVAGALAGIALGVTLPIGVVTGFIVGIGSAAIVHLLVGSPAGRLTLDQVGAALDEIGVEATGLQAGAARTARGRSRDGYRIGRAIPAGEDLRTRCVGRTAARVDVVRALAPWGVAASGGQSVAAGRARGIPDPDGGAGRRAR